MYNRLAGNWERKEVYPEMFIFLCPSSRLQNDCHSRMLFSEFQFLQEIMQWSPASSLPE